MNRKWRRRILGLTFGTFLIVIGTWGYGIYLTDRNLYKPCIFDGKCKTNDQAEIENLATISKLRQEESFFNTERKVQEKKVLGTTYKTTTTSTKQNHYLDNATTQGQKEKVSTHYHVDSKTPQDKLQRVLATQQQYVDGATAQGLIQNVSTTRYRVDSTTLQVERVLISATTPDQPDIPTTQDQYTGSSTIQYQDVNGSKTHYDELRAVLTPPVKLPSRYTPTVPKVLWWDFYSGTNNPRNESIKCKKGVACHSVSSRKFENHPDTMAIIHYGSNFNFMDLPKERRPDIIWGLIHEESLKNADYIFNHQEMLSLFNYTATFKRNSDYPVTTEFLPNLEYLRSKKYFVPLRDKNTYRKEEKLAPIFYIQSDCNTPSHREKYVELLQKYIQIDSYGQCNNNKQLPEYLKFGESMASMNHKDFYKLGAKYKFTLAMENAVCDDYITEKLWRPLHLGSVPIVFGSPKIKDFLPSQKSAIVIEDFNDVKKLAALVHYLDRNDTAYEEYLHFKEKDGITNSHLVNNLNNREWSKYDDFKRPYWSYFNGFECFICEQIHRNMEALKTGKEVQRKIAPVDHYGCPPPKQFNDKGRYVIENPHHSYFWNEGKYKAKAFRYFYDQHLNYTEKMIEDMANSLRKELELI